MSRIYFHSEHEGQAAVRGSERAHFGSMCTGIALGILNVYFKDDPIRRLVPPGSYLHGVDDFAGSFETWFSTGSGIGGDGLHMPDGRVLSTFTVALNTVLTIGNDALRLVARVHGQCEIHGWIDGPNRSWFADLIERGREAHILRDGEGWDTVVALLRRSQGGPIVTSYSVCDSFPSQEAAGWTDDRDGDAFYDLSDAERWHMSMDGLRSRSGFLEWRPGNWADVRMGDGDTAMSIRAMLDAERYAAAR